MKNELKSLFWISGIFLYLIACSPANSTDPKTRLEELQKKQTEINNEIKKLNSDVAGDKVDSSKINYKQVAFTPVQISDFVHTIDVQGKVESDKNIEVNPKTMGIITQVFVTEGQKVKQGQILASIDNQLLKANMEQLKSQYSLAVILYQKQKNLWDQQIGTEVQYLQAKNNKENLEKNMGIVQDQLAQTNIVSPISGTVDQVFARVGQMAAIGATQFRIVNTEVLKVTAGLGENYISQVHVGSPIDIQFPDASLEIKAKLGFVSSVIDPITRTFTVQTKLSGVKGIHPNMVAVFKIQDYQNPKSITIPINVVQNSDEGSFVFVAEKGKNVRFGVARKKLIKTGLIQNGLVEIKQGLNEKDLLITTGYQGLTDGAALSF